MELGGSAAVRAALDAHADTLDQLIKLLEDGGLGGCDKAEALSALQDFERIRNRSALVDHQLVRDAQQRGLDDALCRLTLPRALAAALRITVAEANRRVRAADAVADRVSMLGERLAPTRPHLAAAQRAGTINAEHVDVVERALAKVSGRGFDPADVELGEQLLTEHAMTFGPRELKRLADQVVDRIDPDGTLPDEQLQADRRHFQLRPLRDGGWAGEFRLTDQAGTKLNALLSPLARPRLNTTVTDEGRRVEEPDPRSHGQRMHDALEDVCDRLLRRADAVPDSGGTPATVIITFDLQDLLDHTGYAVGSDGTLIPTEKALTLADAADIYYAATTATGEVLNLGRTRRIASRSQTVALIARDSGCSFPGCDTPPEWAERHHIIPWWAGGLTDLSNLTLLCRYHHHNFATKGWDCQINPDGLPAWQPPAWLDPDRRPLINNRIRGKLSVAATCRRRH